MVGDVVDEATVERALEGCDAVVHAAAVVAIEARRAREVLATNLRAVELVVGGAARRGLGPIVHVSSASALFAPGAQVLNEASPVGVFRSAYGRSKADAEDFVRGLQERGAPVITTYPTGVIGPDDPGLSEGNHTIVVLIRDLFLDTASGFQPVDVRDVAHAHALLVSDRKGPGRYMLAGSLLPWREFGDLLKELTGSLRRVSIPGGLLRAAGRVCDVVKRVRPFDFPLTTEATAYATRWVPVDSSHAREDLGIDFRPSRESLEDCICWLVAAGHLDPARAGRLGQPPPPC